MDGLKCYQFRLLQDDLRGGIQGEIIRDIRSLKNRVTPTMKFNLYEYRSPDGSDPNPNEKLLYLEFTEEATPLLIEIREKYKASERFPVDLLNSPYLVGTQRGL